MFTSEDSYLTLRDLLSQNRPFAVFRLPNETDVTLIIGDETQPVELYEDLQQLNQKRGFVISPFRVDESHPIVLLKESCTQTLFFGDDVRKVNPVFTQIEPRPSAAYSRCFSLFHQSLQEEKFEKLVLSRCQTLPHTKDFSSIETFHRALLADAHCMVWMAFTPQTGLWLGSTPEVILSGENERWEVVALAGTQPLENGELPSHWRKKNQEEQEYVARYVRELLQEEGISAQESEPYSIRAGQLAHLKTDFVFKMQEHDHLGKLLSSLHPTPAVCGLPKKEAFEFIAQNEEYTRGYYSGFIGRLNPDLRTDLYVNLRCVQVVNDKMTFYAGGGLLSSSLLEDEWIETERKLQTMKQIVFR